MADSCDRVPIRQGVNRWVLARTDRDGARAEEVRETAGAFLSRVLGPASPLHTRSIFERIGVPGTGSAEFVIGSARPVLIDAEQPVTLSGQWARMIPLGGEVIAQWLECPVLRTVRAQRPWIVAVDFDWRAQDTVVDWPRRRVEYGVGIQDDHQLDWLLLGAIYQGETKRPDPGTWTETTTERGGEWVDQRVQRAKKQTAELTKDLKWIVGGALFVAVVTFLINASSRRDS